MIETKECAGIGVLRMKHGKANALDTELCTELKTALQQQHAKAVVLTGEGKIFSAGVDLVRLLKDGEDYRRSLLRALSEALHTLFFYPRPVIAAINGHAIAGGCIVACAADHRIMTHEAGRIGIPELLVGVPFPPMALEVMRFNVPAHHLQQLIFRGLTCVPEHALTWGLVDELVEGERLLERALERATELAAIPHESFTLTKLQARQPTLERLQQPSTQQVEVEVEKAWNAVETLAAVREYVETTLGK